MAHNNRFLFPFLCLIIILLSETLQLCNALIGAADPFQLYSCGKNAEGELGVNDTSDKLFPYIIRGVYRPVQISAGQKHSLVSNADGSVYGWGCETRGQLPLIPDDGIPSSGIHGS
mmetsp:Transcript_41851/g.112102  ORF Transcript_41851/g.112102 Transcript_41851/m.112102 type:complete len:116 (-) Transcript_41851:13-360(-)